MKYKRLLTSVTILFFVVVSIICFMFLFRVSDIKLDTTYIENSKEQIQEKSSEYLSTLKGSNLLFVSEKQIEKKLNSISPYIKVEKVEKNYPNGIYVKISEVAESFCIYSDGEYYSLDSSLNVLSKKSANVNNVDNNANILLELDITDYDKSSLQVGKKLAIIDKVTVNYFSLLSKEIIKLRSSITSVKINVYQEASVNRKLTITTIEGLICNIDNVNLLTIEKFNFFTTWYLDIDTEKSGEYTITAKKDTNEIIIAK